MKKPPAPNVLQDEPRSDDLIGCLRALSEDENALIPMSAVIELERNGLVMRGWGSMHVPTAAGRAELAKH